MKAIILAAGKGTRMLPLTLERPKPLIEVAGKSLLRRLLENLPPEVDELIVIVGYLGDMIRAHLGASWKDKPIVYIEQKEINGTLSALHLARSYIAEGERFLFLFSDDVCDKASFAKLLRHDRAILVAPVEHPQRFGIAVTDERGNILDIEEKPEHPRGNLAVTCAYLFDSHIFEYEGEPHSNGEYYLPPVIKKMIKEYPIATEPASLWIPIGYPADLEKAEEILRQKGIS